MPAKRSMLLLKGYGWRVMDELPAMSRPEMVVIESGGMS